MAGPVGLLLFCALTALVCIIGDNLTIRSWRERLFGWGMLDGLQHGAVGLAVGLPLLAQRPHWWLWFTVFAASTLVDVDHFVDFPRWWPVSAEDRLNCRFLHSPLVAVAIGALVAVMVGDCVWGWLIVAGVLSHLWRDATMGTVPVFFPVRWPLKLSRFVYIVSELVLTVGSFLLAGLSSRPV
jgi:hypothetical protein